MELIFAALPALPFYQRLLVAFIGFLLVLGLICGIKGFPSRLRCGILSGALIVSVIGIGTVGVPDERGVLHFVLGMFIACSGINKATNSRPVRSVKWLAILAVPIGFSLGLSVFGVWYWQTHPFYRIDVGWHSAVLIGIGMFAGVATAGVLLFLGHRVPEDHST